MFLPVPGAGLYALGASADDIVRAAAVRVIDGTVYPATRTPADLFREVNEFVSLGYERAEAAGRLVVAEQDVISRAVQVRFERPILLRQARIMEEAARAQR